MRLGPSILKQRRHHNKIQAASGGGFNSFGIASVLFARGLVPLDNDQSFGNLYDLLIARYSGLHGNLRREALPQDGHDS